MTADKVKRAALLAALALPGGLLIMAGGLALKLLADAKTGDEQLDELRLRGRIVVDCLRAFGPLRMAGQDGARIVRACMAIVNNEWDRRRFPDALGVVGDEAARVGPSIGPMQVSRALAIDLQLVAADIARDDYAAKAGELPFCLWAGVLAFRVKLAAADGDIGDAIRRYNGAGAAAEAYRERALRFAANAWGGEALAA